MYHFGATAIVVMYLIEQARTVFQLKQTFYDKLY